MQTICLLGMLAVLSGGTCYITLSKADAYEVGVLRSAEHSQKKQARYRIFGGISFLLTWLILIFGVVLPLIPAG